MTRPCPRCHGTRVVPTADTLRRGLHQSPTPHPDEDYDPCPICTAEEPHRESR